MKRILRTLPFLMASVLTTLSGCDRPEKVNEYGYRFYESSGQNQYIIREGREAPIKLFADTSNPKALKSLQALKWNILYSNAGGDRIFVRGEYYDHSQSFRLTHWYIKVPFEKLDVEDETQVPQKTRTVTKHSLERTDFEATNGFDPNDQTFDPTTFQRPR